MLIYDSTDFFDYLQPYVVRYLVSVIVHKKPDLESLSRIQNLLKFLNAELKSKSLTKVSELKYW